MEKTLQAGHEYTRRRSQRFAHRVPVILNGLDPSKTFSESCETTDVSMHGCQVRTLRRLDAGQRVRLHVSHPETELEARVARVRPDLSAMAWEVGLELDEPGNVWALEFSHAMFQWPADLLAPHYAEPLMSKQVVSWPEELSESHAEESKGPSAPMSRPEAESGEAEFRGRAFQIVRDASEQLTRNAQFALNTAETGIRDMGKITRREMEEWLARQRPRIEQQFQQLAETTRTAMIEEALDTLRSEAQKVLSDELNRFRLHVNQALQAGLETFLQSLRQEKSD